MCLSYWLMKSVFINVSDLELDKVCVFVFCIVPSIFSPRILDRSFVLMYA